MKLLILVLFFSFSFGLRSDNASEYLSLETNNSKEDHPVSFSEAVEYEAYYPFLEDGKEEYFEKSGYDKLDVSAEESYSNENHNFSWPTTYERDADKHLLEHLIEIYLERYRSNEENFQKEETYPSEGPTRRQITNQKTPDEYFQYNNTPDNLEVFYPKFDPAYIQNDFSNNSSHSLPQVQKSHSFAELPEGLKDTNYTPEYPQYYQKNYYYNYYPLTKSPRNMASNGGEGKSFNSEINREKIGERKSKKNPCRQYLEFLRYAFKELDENPEYDYEYNDDWGDSEGQKPHHLFMTQMYGPTLYVGNSGKISQMTSKGDGVKMVEDIFTSSKVSSLARNFVQTKPTLPSFTIQDAENETYLSNFESSLQANNETQQRLPGYEFQLSRVFPAWTSTMDDYSTKLATDPKEKTIFDYEDNDTATTPMFTTTTATPDRFSLGEYYVTLKNSKEGALSKGNFDNSSSSVGPSLYWHTKSSTNAPWVNPLIARTTISFDSSVEEGKEKDCNDKMLPCPDTVNITYPLNGYCNRYVSCESGRAIRRTCPDGLHFNIITKSCDFPHNSFCTYFCPKANGMFGIPGDCSGYFICKNFVLEYRMCPPKMHWDVKRGICMFAELSSCPMKCFNTNEVKHYEGDCKAYIVCLNGYPYYHKCPPNTKFDVRVHSCISDKQSQCQDDPRLMTKTSNPNSLCKDIEIKFGTKLWCNYFQNPENRKS